MTDNTINNDVTMSGASGTLLAGRYRVVRQLGQGGMGSVWLAEDTKLDNHPVAVKMLPSILVSNKRAYQQVKQEALVSLKLSHPNIATVRAFEEENGSPFLVMDYIDGQTLDDFLAEKGTLTEEETIRLLKPVAAALDYAHKQGVVHRDVKPGNVMIRKDGTPFVLDFGIAREIQETMTRVTGKLSSGTLMYMSPEQLNGASPKPAQDIYSLSAMMYECLIGHPPFCRGQIEYQIVNNKPEPLPADCLIADGVMAGLSKNPEDRPATCAAVLSSAGETRAPRATVSAVKPKGKSRGGLIAATFLALASIGAVVWFSDMARTPSAPAVVSPQSVVQVEKPQPVEPPIVTQVGVQLWENGPYWATCNVGATKPEECGYYFWWGDTVGYKRNASNNGWVSAKDGSSFSFRSGNCPTYGKDNSQLQSAGYIDSTGNLVAEHDAATAYLGAPWRMPTDAEFSALISNCDTEWTTRNGVAGRLVKGRGAYASRSIFLPAAGDGNDSYLYALGSYGNYWSSTPDSTPYSDYFCDTWYLTFNLGYFSRGCDDRFYGHSVRPVRGFAK